jgi:hypothetical protein
MQHFYDGQIRRYITQIIRLMSNFSYKDGKGNLVQVPVMYGDMTRQVANIIRDNSENKIPSAPRIAVHITGMEMDRTRSSDSSFISKINVVERAYDDQNKQYLNTQGKNYTVERLMPTPYTLSVNADVWSTNTDQKLQILEQIFMLFNPSLEIQTTDNYVDWTSLSVVNLDQINFSSRSIPVGVETEIDVATLSFTTPIFISPPAKVKRLGIITNVITSIFNETTGDIDLSLSRPELNAYDDSEKVIKTDLGKNVKGSEDSLTVTSALNYGIYVTGGLVQIVNKSIIGETVWTDYVELQPGTYVAGLSKVYLSRQDLATEIVGTFAINESDPTQLVVNWDTDTFPTDTVINQLTGIDYIINPETFNPTTVKGAGTRLLILGDIGSPVNTDGPDAWKNTNGSDFVAKENDIIEWDGSSWSVIFEAATQTDITYVTNRNTSVQYKWANGEWIRSVEGEYQNGAWRLVL